jgi:hypothetical protein
MICNVGGTYEPADATVGRAGDEDRAAGDAAGVMALIVAATMVETVSGEVPGTAGVPQDSAAKRSADNESVSDAARDMHTP